jgi:hypothetical protein
MTKPSAEVPDRRPVSISNLTLIVLGMLMAYSVVLLWLGLSVPATVGLVTTLAGVTVEVTRRATQHSRSRRRQDARGPRAAEDGPAAPGEDSPST